MQCILSAADEGYLRMLGVRRNSEKHELYHAMTIKRQNKLMQPYLRFNYRSIIVLEMVDKYR